MLMAEENCGIRAELGALYNIHDRMTGDDSSTFVGKMGDKETAGYFKARAANDASFNLELAKQRGGSPLAQKFISKHPWVMQEYMQNPDFVLGENYVKYYQDLVKEWHAEVHDQGFEKDMAEQKRLYNEIVVPEVRQGQADIRDGIEGFEGNQRAYAQQYLKDLEDGLTVFGSPNRHDIAQKIKSGLVTGFMKWNPLTALMHVTSLQRVAGLTDVHILHGLVKTAKTGIFDKTLQREMVYGAGAGHGGGLVGLSDNMIKTVAYHAEMAKSGNKEKAFEVARRASMAIDPANAPSYFRDRGSLWQLVRFEIEGQKYNAQNMYDLVHGARTGNTAKAKQAGIALASSAAAYYLLGGRHAFVPKIVAMFMPKPDENEEQLPGEAALAKGLNLDLTDKMQPIGGDILGITTRMVTDTGKSIQKSLAKGRQADEEGDPEAAHQAYLDAFVKSSLFWGAGLSSVAGQAVGGVKGLVIQTAGELGTGINGQRAYKAGKEMIKEDQAWDYFLKRMVEKSLPLRETMTDQGAADKEWRKTQRF